VNDRRYDSLLYSLDHAIELFSRIPTSTPAGAAAFETLKQARAMLTEALAQEASYRPGAPRVSEQS
jgi:hypothetical protein